MSDQGVPVAMSIARGLYPADHPIYGAIAPSLSYMGLMMAVATGYEQGVAAGRAQSTGVTTRTIRKTIVTSDKPAILAMLRQLAEAVEREGADKAGVLVDWQKTHRAFFAHVLEAVEQFEVAARPPHAEPHP